MKQYSESLNAKSTWSCVCVTVTNGFLSQATSAGNQSARADGAQSRAKVTGNFPHVPSCCHTHQALNV